MHHARQLWHKLPALRRPAGRSMQRHSAKLQLAPAAPAVSAWPCRPLFVCFPSPAPQPQQALQRGQGPAPKTAADPLEAEPGASRECREMTSLVERGRAPPLLGQGWKPASSWRRRKDGGGKRGRRARRGELNEEVQKYMHEPATPLRGSLLQLFSMQRAYSPRLLTAGREPGLGASCSQDDDHKSWPLAQAGQVVERCRPCLLSGGRVPQPGRSQEQVTARKIGRAGYELRRRWRPASSVRNLLSSLALSCTAPAGQAQESQRTNACGIMCAQSVLHASIFYARADTVHAPCGRHACGGTGRVCRASGKAGAALASPCTAGAPTVDAV